MSRVAKVPVSIPKGINVSLQDQQFSAKGPKGQLSIHIHPLVNVEVSDDLVSFSWGDTLQAKALAGTMRALVQNIVRGVSEGFEIRLKLVGIGYRAQMQGSGKLVLNLGFSHSIEYVAPEGVNLSVNGQDEVVVQGSDKQKVGQAAAIIRAYRPPEPYKGKGVRYVDEVIVLRETKKKK